MIATVCYTLLGPHFAVLFDQHAGKYSVVTEAIDFSRVFELAEQYRDRDRYLAAATVYRGVIEGIDDNLTRVDAAYDHYTQTLQSALDGYVECMQAADLEAEQFDSYAAVLEVRASSEPVLTNEQFKRALDDLKSHRQL